MKRTEWNKAANLSGERWMIFRVVDGEKLYYRGTNERERSIVWTSNRKHGWKIKYGMAYGVSKQCEAHGWEVEIECYSTPQDVKRRAWND